MNINIKGVDMKLTKLELSLTKEYEGKLFIDWENAYLDMCESKEDILKYKVMKKLAKKLYSDNDDVSSIKIVVDKS